MCELTLMYKTAFLYPIFFFGLLSGYWSFLFIYFFPAFFVYYYLPILWYLIYLPTHLLSSFFPIFTSFLSQASCPTPLLVILPSDCGYIPVHMKISASDEALDDLMCDNKFRLLDCAGTLPLFTLILCHIMKTCKVRSNALPVYKHSPPIVNSCSRLLEMPAFSSSTFRLPFKACLLPDCTFQSDPIRSESKIVGCW